MCIFTSRVQSTLSDISVVWQAVKVYYWQVNTHSPIAVCSVVGFCIHCSWVPTAFLVFVVVTANCCTMICEFLALLLLWQYERMWRAKKTEESYKAYREQTQKLNQMMRAAKEEYYAIHGGGPVSCLQHLLCDTVTKCQWLVVYPGKY